MTTPTTPAVSIVVATYNRSRALACAIESARRQELCDWEMVVVGDACTDDTEKVVRDFDDPRIRFINLARNTGDQSGPNNVGAAASRAPLIAFLNQDDVWLEDHLTLCRERLLAESADLVFSTAAGIAANSPLPLSYDTLQIALIGLGRRNRWTPGLDGSVAVGSSWLVRRDAFERLGGWRPARECTVESSQDLLFRAWRSKMRLRPINLVTLVVVASGTRTGSYVGNEAVEQEWVLEEMTKPGFAAELAGRAGESSATALARDTNPERSPWVERAAVLLAHCGINPRAVEFRLRRGFAPGEYLHHLRSVRGLHAVGDDAGSPAAVRAELVRRSCIVEPGTTIGFRAGGGGARHLLSGWSTPDGAGVWNDGSSAQLLFGLGAPPAGDVTIELVAEAFTPDGARAVEVAVGTHHLATWEIGAGKVPGRFVVPRDLVPGSAVPLTLEFGDLQSPRALGLSDDARLVAIRLVSGRVIDRGTL